MGVARLLAKGWLMFCLFTGAHAAARAVLAGTAATQAIGPSAIPALLFGAMGLLFIAGYGLSSGHLVSRFKPHHVVPGFNEIVFMIFAILSFAIQVAPHLPSWGILVALQGAIRFAVPAQRVLENNLANCGIGGGGLASSFAASWLLAFVFLGSAISRVRMAAALVRLERKRRVEPLGAPVIALVLGFASVGGIQLMFVGSLFRWLSCSVLGGILGSVVTGAAPLMLSYLVAAALTNLLATGPDS